VGQSGVGRSVLQSDLDIPGLPHRLDQTFFGQHAPAALCG
jgi:hypothetical protein